MDYQDNVTLSPTERVCIQLGRDVSHFHVSIIMGTWGGGGCKTMSINHNFWTGTWTEVHRHSPQTTAFEQEVELKWMRTRVRLLIRQTPDRLTGPHRVVWLPEPDTHYYLAFYFRHPRYSALEVSTPSVYECMQIVGILYTTALSSYEFVM